MQFNYRTPKNAQAVSQFWGKSINKPDWYKVQALAEDAAEIMIYDVIGWPFNDANDLVKHIAGLKGQAITVRLNSPGGDVFDGMSIYNALKAHDSKVTIRIESLAASIASIIAMAGNEVQAYANSMLMIHDPWCITAGNQYELRDIADLLGKISGNMVDIYASESSVGKREVKQMMKDETWLTAQEVKEKGFIDTIIQSGKPVKAQFDVSMYANAPDGIINAQADEGGKELTKREIERALRDAGAKVGFARAVAAGYNAAKEPEPEKAVCEAIENLIKRIRS